MRRCLGGLGGHVFVYRKARGVKGILFEFGPTGRLPHDIWGFELALSAKLSSELGECRMHPLSP